MRSRLTRNRIIAALTALTGSAGLVFLYFVSPFIHAFYPRCLFYETTHWLCPGCGGTRALYELLHLNLRSAMHFNALVTIVAPVALVWLLFSCYHVLRYDRFPAFAVPRSLAYSLLALALLFMVARNSGIAFSI